MDPLKKFTDLDPTKKAFSLLDEFKTFALKGNMIDLAVGVIIGAAFGTIVKSLVDNIFMPLIGAIVGTDPKVTEGYKAWHLTLNGSTIHIGLFFGDVLNFLLVALILFLFVQKFLGFLLHLRKKEELAATPLTPDQQLLTEIRDCLRQEPEPQRGGV